MHRVQHETLVVAGLDVNVPQSAQDQRPAGAGNVLSTSDVDLINQAPDLAYLAGPPGTGKTLTAVIMSMEWLRQHGTVDILSRHIYSLAAAHLIKQQLKETARQILGEEAASRVHLHDNLEEDGAVDRLVVTLTARPTSNICLIADEAGGFGTREHFRYDNNHNNVLQQHRYNDIKR
nr:hypothetical protein BaRGS_016084 [Batillaria attramentaria]